MFFITNRCRKGGDSRNTPHVGSLHKLMQPFEFDLDNNAASNSIFFCQTTDDGGYEEIGSLNFLSEIQKTNYKQVLIYIHGFSNLPDTVIERAKELQDLCGGEDGEILVVPLIWPCDNDMGVVKDYWDDQKSADQSAFSFARVLEKFLEWGRMNEQAPCLKRINIIVHSMGARVFRNTLKVWHKYDLPQGLPLIFRNTFLVAPDIVNESLHRGNKGELICDVSRNVVVYHASDDLALRASKVANVKNKIASRRLGHTGPEDMDKTPKKVYCIDCDDVNTLYDFPTGHSYFLRDQNGDPGLVFNHMLSCIKRGRVFVEDNASRSTVISINIAS